MFIEKHNFSHHVKFNVSRVAVTQLSAPTLKRTKKTEKDCEVQTALLYPPPPPSPPEPHRWWRVNSLDQKLRSSPRQLWGVTASTTTHLAANPPCFHFFLVDSLIFLILWMKQFVNRDLSTGTWRWIGVDWSILASRITQTSGLPSWRLSRQNSTTVFKWSD